MNTEGLKGTVLRGLAGVHLVAGELARRGYIPNITLGNIPLIDIVATPSDNLSRSVPIQVKELRSSNRVSGWMIKPKNILRDILYVLVEMPDDETVPAKFFVLNAEEMKPLCDNHPKMNSVRLPRNSEAQFRDKWDKLERMA